MEVGGRKADAGHVQTGSGHSLKGAEMRHLEKHICLFIEGASAAAHKVRYACIRRVVYSTLRQSTA